MKRIGLIALLAIVTTVGVFAQDISLIGQDFEHLIVQLGDELLPNLEQSAAWGAFPGLAVMPSDTGFFMTMGLGALLSGGIFQFAVPDNPAFEVLDIGPLMQAILDASGSERATNVYNGVQNFFPYPVTRTTIGYVLPAGVEMMVDFSIFPQFVANLATRIASGADASISQITLNALHVGSKVRVPVLRDAGPFPAVSLGAAYSYAGLAIGYGDLGSIGPVATGIGDLYLDGEFMVSTRIHSFGLDLQVSKALGVFVPFIGVSPQYHVAQVAGHVGTSNADFSAGIDLDSDGTTDSTYFGDHPDVTSVDNDLSFLLHGGFDLNFEKFAMEFHGSWIPGTGSPGVFIGMRIQ